MNSFTPTLNGLEVSLTSKTRIQSRQFLRLLCIPISPLGHEVKFYKDPQDRIQHILWKRNLGD